MKPNLRSLPPRGSQILGIGSWQPDRVVTNEELSTKLDTSDEWIRQRVGIIERRYADSDETLVDMAVQAGRNALADAGLSPDLVDTVIVPNCSMPAQIPNAAARVAYQVGAHGAGAFDLNAGCSGFCYGLAVGSDLIRAASARYVLVIGAEKLTDFVNPLDRTTAVIFADGAGAVLIGPSKQTEIGPVVWGSAGEQADKLGIDEHGYVQQSGNTIFRWAITKMPSTAIRALDAVGLTVADIDVLLPHQANMRIIKATEAALRTEGLRDDVTIADDIQYSGNTSAASVPIALDHLRKQSRMKSGDIVVTVAAGAGLTYAGQVLVWP
ncbi:3-oxoacyl-[acyl-carrier-protein] synthase-3 [Streptomyces sp. V4I8]|uniref:beta-ketoacyl-ACP synthase III n=1 Tax=Streptomyces sp. V4I8 TaxID=3156469 RepID=UPI00351402DD